MVRMFAGLVAWTAAVAATASAGQILTLVEQETHALLANGRGMALSPDGKHVYVIDAVNDALLVFAAVPGGVDFVEVQQDGVGGVDGLDLPEGIAVSPDGKHVTVAAGADDAIAVFERDASTGALTFVEAEPGTFGLGVATLVVSPDGRHLYVKGGIYERDAVSGELSLLATTPDLGNGSVLAITPDGRFLYTYRLYGMTALARDPATGLVSPINETSEPVGVPGGLAVSPDARHAYWLKNGIAVFQLSRKNGRGGLLPGPSGDECTFATAVALSPDGTQVFAGCNNGVANDPVRAYDRSVKKGRVTRVDGLPEPIPVALAVSPDARRLYALSTTSVAGGATMLAVYALDPCGPLVPSRLVARKVNTEVLPGNDQLTVKGQVQVRHGTFADLDPLTTAVRVLVERADGSPAVDVTLPTTAFGGSGTAGWTASGTPVRRWTFSDRTGTPPNGVKRVVIADRSKRVPNLVSVSVTGRDGTYPLSAGDEPPVVSVFLGATDVCGKVVYAPADCAFVGAGDKLRCKRAP
jgi:DNA-binding beta-propeller fold protein YncE